MRGSLARVFTATAARGVQRQQARRMGAGPPGGYWADGQQPEGHRNGNLFGETPPPPGQSRIWEDWEIPWYTACFLAPTILIVGLYNKPNTNLTDWAREEAIARLAVKEAALGEEDALKRLQAREVELARELKEVQAANANAA